MCIRDSYYNLISAFEKLSDTPILFNTSFNLGGDPLVETIDDAIDTLEKSKIDWMYLPEIQKLVYVPQNKIYNNYNWFHMEDEDTNYQPGFASATSGTI